MGLWYKGIVYSLMGLCYKGMVYGLMGLLKNWLFTVKNNFLHFKGIAYITMGLFPI